MIKKIKFYLMVLNDYLFLGTETSKILDKYDETELQLPLVKTKINAALNRLKNSMKLLRGSLITEELATLDTDRDNAWKCFYHCVISQSYRLNPSIRESAHMLAAIIKLPEMRVRYQGYKEQTATMINFFNRIDSDPELVTAIEAVGATTFYNELKTAETAFENKLREKVAEGATKPRSDSEEAVKDIRKAFDDLSQFLNIMSQLSGKAEYTRIADEVNEIVDQINTEVQARSTRRENAKEEVEQAVEN